MNRFEHIRPYHDDEVVPVVNKLIETPEFINTISALKFPYLHRYLPWFAKYLVRAALKSKTRTIKDVHTFQLVVEKELDRVIDRSTTSLSFSGLENLKPGEPHLFISNHRDIAMDSAFVNYALYHHGRETMRIAIGDNLLQKPFASDLMRLNKSFIVNRSATAPREKLAAYMDLSSYICHSIEEGSCIWIAQKEGRAKDGIDQTESAIIKMLYMNQKKGGKPFSEYMNWLSIVPITISYEYNPCDQLIAHELATINTYGEYEKQPGEDLSSIAKGITGNKGHVHVAFGEPLSGEFNEPEDVAEAIDQQIIANYHLHPSNHIAKGIQEGSESDLAARFGEEKVKEFMDRYQASPKEEQPYILAMYANSVKQKEQAVAE